jgi:hypothetical protein
MASEPDFPDPAECVGLTVLLRTRDLNLYHRNPRKGDVDEIAASLKINGQFTPIIVNAGTHTGRPNEVLAGNHTLKAFRQLAEQNPFDTAWAIIKAHVVDVDDDDLAQRIVLVDNRSFEMGEGYDDQIVHELLSEVGTTGTGYTDADLDALDTAFAKSSENDNGEGEQTPDEPETPDLPQRDPAIGFTIVFDDEDQQEAWFAWVKNLRDEYPDYETVGERLLAHLEDTAKERA